MTTSQTPSGFRGYLDTPSMGLPTSATIAAMTTALELWSEGRADYADWERSMERCRSMFAQLFDVSHTTVGLLPSVVPAFAAAAASVAKSAGTVVAHRNEFRSVLLPVLAHVDEHRIRWVDGPYVADTFLQAMDDKTAAVLVSAVSSHDGGRPSLATLTQAGASVGARILVDGTQAAGIVVPDVAVASLSLFACAGYKGLRAPRGAAYAVAHDDVVSGFGAPSAYGVSDNEERGSYGPPLRRKPGAQGLDQSPAWFAWVGAEPALAELLLQPATDRESRVVGLAQKVCDHLLAIGIPAQQTDLPSPIVTFRADAGDLLDQLTRRGVRAVSRLGRIRLGFHIYNDENDVDMVQDVLTQWSTRPHS